MKSISICLLAAIVFYSCNNQSDQDQIPGKVTGNDSGVHQIPGEPVIDLVSGCFMNVTGRDTLAAHLKRHGDEITGKLSFDNYQKDGSAGPVKGELKGDIIQLTYSFSSEGTNSVMQVYFKVENNSLVRGIGNMDVRGDTAYFTNPAQITYTGTELARMDCSKIPSKYK